ncbi:hypothetical protein [Corynebacterium variabile]|uniref:hypothetical protein n=1 Tax=Corynebacterium variabile TaxID=1727 RepID=UPI00289DE8D7|nr:hypothetical protein [Corynebacterium variabile]
MTDYRLTAERALKEITAALDTIAATITAALDNLATVDAPEPTLAEELRDVADSYGMSSRAADRVDDIADRVEHDLTEARAEVERVTAQNTWPKHTPSGHTYDAPTTYKKLRQQCANAAQAASEGWDDAECPPEPTWEMVGLATTEVEHLTAKNEQLRSYVQKGAESNAETPDPADVKPGEAWKAHIWYDEEWHPGTAIKSSGGDWTVTRDDGSRTTYRMNEYIELVSRLVPAPRVITNPDELDRLAIGTIIRTREDLAMQKKDGDTARWYYADSGRGWEVAQMLDDLPATVLWEPEA